MTDHLPATPPPPPPPSPARFEIRLIDSSSPHFVALECWGLWDRERNEFLRVPGSSDRVRRFYTVAAAAAFRASSRETR
ncbi:hypothetical protein ACIRST_26300 [Kitasatospora sp. NPDC101447]|uniref:hypothetical protein n=1 Tax=Kitasatospora sp. NPDC101447 TaxID=3364102 RepID=UPI00380010CC